MTERLALIDGDILLYSVGFSVEHNHYDVTLDGEFLVSFPSYDLMWEFFPYCSEEMLKGVDWTKRVITDPLSFAYHNLKRSIEAIVKNTNAYEYMIFYSGKENFRDKIATIQKYKGNRDPAAKPVYYSELRNYLRSEYGAIESVGQEADDEIGIMHTRLTREGKNSIICTKDKDLNMIPGEHYNLTTGKITNVNEEDATRWFYTQLLTGDPVDNVRGVRGVGPKKAEKVLEGCSDESSYVESVSKVYTESCGETWKEQLIENARLLWIRQEPEQEPPCLSLLT